MDKMIVSSNSDEANQKAKPAPEEKRLPVVKETPHGKSEVKAPALKTSETKPLGKIQSSSNDSINDSKSDHQKQVKVDHKKEIEDLHKSLKAEFEQEKVKLEREQKTKLDELRAQITEETEEEEAKLKEEQMTTLMRLRQKLKSETGEEEKKMRAEMHENLKKSQTDNEKLEKKKQTDLEMAKLKLEKEIAEQKLKLEEEKQERLRDIRVRHEKEMDDVIKREEKLLEEKKNVKLEEMKEKTAISAQIEQKINLNAQIDQHERTVMMEEVLSDKIHEMQKEHEKQIRDLQGKHEERMNRMRDDQDAQAKREKERLKTKMEYEHKVELNRLDQELSRKKEQLAEKYQRQMSELQNDLDMLNTRRSYLTTQNEDISKLTQKNDKRIAELKAKSQNGIDSDQYVPSPRRSKPTTPRQNPKDLDRRLQLEDLVERDGEFQTHSAILEDPPSENEDNLLQNYLAKKASQKEEEGIRSARDFLQKQRSATRNSLETRAWQKERKSVSAETQELLKRIQRGMLDQEAGLERRPNVTEQLYPEDRIDGTYTGGVTNGPMNGRLSQAVSVPDLRPERFSSENQKPVPDDVMRYLHTVDEKLNKVLGLVATNLPAQPPRNPLSSVQPTNLPPKYDFSNYQRPHEQWSTFPQPGPPIPTYPSLRDTWHNSVQSRVDEELRNMSKYFGYSFENHPPPSIPYRAARELIETSTPTSLPPKPFSAWGFGQPDALHRSGSGEGLLRHEPARDVTASPRSGGVKLVIDAETNELKAVSDS